MLVLDAIRQLLQFKGWTTIPEIAKIAEKKQAKVLEIVNANLPFIRRDKKRGRIVGLEGYVSEQTEYFLCNNYYRIEDYYGHKYVMFRFKKSYGYYSGNRKPWRSIVQRDAQRGMNARRSYQEWAERQKRAILPFAVCNLNMIFTVKC